MKRIIGLLLLSITILFTAVLSSPNRTFGVGAINRDNFTNHDFNVNWDNATSNIKSYSDYKTNHLGTTNSFVISFNSAEELYNFSVDVSYQNNNMSLTHKQHLMTKTYTLGKDIDYSVMRGSRFIPIGFDFTYPNTSNSPSLKFSGHFDGRGFEISNLYLAGYNDITIDYQPPNVPDSVLVATSNYHAMFNYLEPNATIKNVGLINPTIDVASQNDDLKYFANLVGENKGIIENVFVNENRTINEGSMRIAATPTNDPLKQKSAAGIVHTNNGGSLSNAYFAGEAVVNASYIYALKVEPVIFNGTGTNIVHDSDLYKESVVVSNTTIPIEVPLNSTPTATQALKEGNNDLLENTWYYYEADRYPALWGLEYNANEKYEIKDAVDLITLTKLLRLTTIKNNAAYRISTFVLTNNINMEDLAPDAYQVPQVDFAGTLDGNDYQISNLSLSEGVNIGSGYYLGLFSVLSGTVKDLKLQNIAYNPINYENFFGQQFYIGSIASVLNNGLINNVYVSGDINLGNSKLGVFSIGGIVGQASGQVVRVYSEVNIDLGSHTYGTNEFLENKFNLGGIVGSTTNTHILVLYNAKNIGNLNTITTTNLETSDINDLANFNTGGVIGYVNNNNINHNLGLITNEGNITIGAIGTGASPIEVTNHVAGVIGHSTGGVYQFNKYQGLWENLGNIDFTNANQTTKAAGVIVSNHSMLMTYVQMFSESNLSITNSNVTAAALLYNIGGNININQAKTTGSFNYELENKSLSVGIYNENTNNKMNLKYVEINTDINIDVNNTSEVSYAGVTLLNEVNYQNVVYEGTFNVKDDTNTSNSSLWIAGITKELTNNYIMKDSMASGNINVVANKQGNIYVGGLVNRNLSGNLHTKDGQARPKTTIGGIINSVNRANIYSTEGIRGRSNIFVGGIATMNSGSIQDAINFGDIMMSNLDTYVDSRVRLDNNEFRAGLTELFESGVIAGGVSAIITNGHSRIYDTSNRGNIIGLSEHFVRTGGILGVSLLAELKSGNINTNLYQESEDMTNPEFISNSILSNGINYGNVSAISKTIGIYNGSFKTENQQMYVNSGAQDVTPSLVGPTMVMSSTAATVERIGLYSAAGGIIGYGLSEMYRMINHGEISGTDAAGGIVGGTFIYVAPASGVERDGGTTIVKINTAINYGDIRAIKNQSYEDISKSNINYLEISDLFYPTNDPFIIPEEVNSNPDIRRHPQSKRGFGGIFGRILRGGNQIMTSEGGSFDFIVNMDENVDLIGRLDQNYNFSWSGTAFRFYDAIYYSAKENDTTQAVFTGFEYIKEGETFADGTGTIQVRYRYDSEGWLRPTYYKQLQYYIPSNITFNRNNKIYHQIGRRSQFSHTEDESVSYPQDQWFDFGARESDPTTKGSGTTTEPSIEVSGTTSIGTQENIYEFTQVRDVPYISEDITNPNAEYVYDTNFTMRDDAVLVGGEPITSFIYYAENALLADHFQTTRPNGMYVLSTSAGSDYGSVLPRNFNITNFNPLTKEVPTDVDYNNLEANSNYNGTTWFEGVDSNLVLGYESLYQTRLNDKSALLEENQVFEIQDRNTSNVKLQDPVIAGNEITFDIYRNMLNGNQQLSFEITSALLPSNALIANSNITHSALNASTDSNIATGSDAPNLTINLANHSGGNILLGTFISFSEAAVEDIAFYNQTDGLYQTQYTIYLNIIETPIVLPSGPEVMVDNATNWSNYTNNKVTITNKLGVRFRDQTIADGGFISDTFTMDQYLTLYYLDNNNVRTPVDSNYYTITSTLKNNRYFSFEIDFSDLLRPGDHYVIGYKFFGADTEKDIFVNYNRVITNEINNLIANTGTTYNKNGTINGDLAFGDESLLGLSMTNVTTIIDENIAPYLNNTTYLIDGIEYFSTSNFFEITDFSVQQVLSLDGYYEYHLNFILSSSNNVTITLKEREIDPTYYKDTIRIPNGTTNITREATESLLALDYEFIVAVEATFNISNFNILVDGQLLNAFDPTEELIKVSYQNGLLRFIFTDKLLPKVSGSSNNPYIITVELVRGTNNTLPAGILEITKLEGVSAYLSDIRFSAIVTETSYADVTMANNIGTPIINSGYNPNIYFGGIDYDNSDVDLETNYRIDGKVQKVPLDDYLPIMVDYLPTGATIQRKYNDGFSQTPNWMYTSPVKDITDQGYTDLFGNFTINQETGNPVVANEDAIITYKVTSEDGSLEVFYHITVVDATNNVTLSFEFKYRDGNDIVHEIDSIASPLKEELISVNITNQEADGVVYKAGFTKNSVINDVENFPTFTSITETNTVTNMFYVPNITGLSYRFARNQSGFYQFRIELPKGYDYEIYYKSGISEQLLNLYSENIPTGNNQGYYYYINYSESLRTSAFSVIIYDTSFDNDWGLTDSN